LAEQPIQYAVDGGVFSAGAAVDWARELGLFQSVDELNRFDAPPAIERGLAFVPALTGLACPHWDREAGALWIGMRPQTGRRDLLQALLEGVALRAAEVIASMAGLITISGTLSLDGGLCNSPYFCQFLCDALQRPVRVPAFRELTALGAAQLAALGASYEAPADGFEYAVYTPGRPPEATTAWRDRFAQAVRYSGGWWAQ
jgi:glycerol kinase